MIQIVKNKVVLMVIGLLGAMGLFQTLSITGETGREAVAYSNSFLSVWVCILSPL